MGYSVGIFPLFWPVPRLRAPCHFLADSHPVASWTEGTGKVWGGRRSAVSPAILGASVPGPQLAEAPLRAASSPLTTHTPLGLPHLLPWAGWGWGVGTAGVKKAASHSLTPEALVWGLHPITQLEGPSVKVALGLGRVA